MTGAEFPPEAIARQFFYGNFLPEESQAEVDLDEAAAFTQDFYNQYEDLFTYDNGLVFVAGVNEFGQLFDSHDLQLNREPGKRLCQTIMLGLEVEANAWQLAVVDSDHNTLYQLKCAEGQAITVQAQHFNRQHRLTFQEELPPEDTEALFQAIYFFAGRPEVIESARSLRIGKAAQLPEIAATHAKRERTGQPLTTDDILLISDIEHIGFQPLPWRFDRT